MRVKVLVFAASLLLIASCSAGNPQTPAATSSSPQRDPQAIAIMTKCLTAFGGTAAVSGIQDFTETGTISFNWANQPVTGSVTVYGKGLHLFRMDANVSGGTQSLIVSEGGGSSADADGKKVSLPFYNVMTAGSLSFPATRIAAALINQSTVVTYVGLVTKDESQVYQLHIAPTIDPALTLHETLAGLGSFDLLIDPTSNQLVELSETIWPSTGTSQSYLHEILFSKYTVANGLAVPFGIIEKFGGQQTWSMTLNSISFNSGLADSLFNF